LGDVEFPGRRQQRVDRLGTCIITYGKLFLLSGAYPLEELSLRLSVFPRSRRRWDGFPARVHTDGRTWVSIAMSLHALHETDASQDPEGSVLIHSWEVPGYA
jgi:hypothetical protein